MNPRDRCVVCKQPITDTGWVPVCCEVCWDSMDAYDRRTVGVHAAALAAADPGEHEIRYRYREAVR